MQAVTFDFYNTLVYHRAGKGRGRQFQEYLSGAGLDSDPWEHQVLYDVFEYYGASYSPALPETAQLTFWTEFTRRLFERTSVRARGPIDYAAHAQAIRDIMGPHSFAVFDEAVEVLRGLQEARLRLGVISDWQKGLVHFCDELGIGRYLEVVVASGEAGYQKPDRRLFETARERMNIVAQEILHVGDRAEDIEGAHAAGFAAALLVRSGGEAERTARVITSLREVFSLV